jgi:DNA-binding CsgD family transcriptional regulator
MKQIDVNEELLIYQFGNGIKLINPNQTKNSYSSQLGNPTKHTVASILQCPLAVFFENTEYIVMKCNEINAEGSGFSSINECTGSPWFKPYKKKNIIPALKTAKQIVQNNVKVVEENEYLRKDDSSVHTFSVKMPWYDSGNKIFGLFGCSIILGKNPLLQGLSEITALGFLNQTQMNGAEINSVYLTKREIDCLNLTIRGKTAKEIAAQLKISSWTVEEHLTNIKRKMNVHSKSALIDKTIDYYFSRSGTAIENLLKQP